MFSQPRQLEILTVAFLFTVQKHVQKICSTAIAGNSVTFLFTVQEHVQKKYVYCYLLIYCSKTRPKNYVLPAAITGNSVTFLFPVQEHVQKLCSTTTIGNNVTFIIYCSRTSPKHYVLARQLEVMLPSYLLFKNTSKELYSTTTIGNNVTFIIYCSRTRPRNGLHLLISALWHRPPHPTQPHPQPLHIPNPLHLVPRLAVRAVMNWQRAVSRHKDDVWVY